MQEWGRIGDNLETRSEALNPKEGKTEHDGWRAWTREGKEVSTPVPALSAPYVMVYLQSGVWYFPYKIIMKVKLYCVCKITFCEMNGKQIWPMIGPIFQMDRKMGFNHDGVLGWYSRSSHWELGLWAWDKKSPGASSGSLRTLLESTTSFLLLWRLPDLPRKCNRRSMSGFQGGKLQDSPS